MDVRSGAVESGPTQRGGSRGATEKPANGLAGGVFLAHWPWVGGACKRSPSQDRRAGVEARSDRDDDGAAAG